jgi:putative ABC transport system permease protein
VVFKGQKFTVAGVFESKSLLESGAVVMSIKKLQKIKGVAGKITALNLKVRLSDASEETPEKLDARIEAARHKIEQLFPELEAKNVQAFMTTNTPLFLVKNFTWAISLVAFLIVVLGILNTMTMSVLERTSEIGILRAMG